MSKVPKARPGVTCPDQPIMTINQVWARVS